WVGTGEGNLSGDCFAGVGLYRVKNADTSPALEGPFETRTGSASTTHAFLNTAITQIVIDPANNNNIWVGNTFGRGGRGGVVFPSGGANPPVAFLGLYFSADAQSANPTWVRVANLPGGGLGAVTDIVREPGNSNNLVVGLMDFNATASGIYRSTNATQGGN